MPRAPLTSSSSVDFSLHPCGGVRVGTSGFHYKHWLGNFYPAKLPASKMLEYYWQFFDTVELNNSFYQLPKPRALESWRDSTPDSFCFAVKGSRFLTHMKKLKDPRQGLDKFLNAVELLSPKLGPILFQLPPHWTVDLERLQSFLECLPPAHQYAFEFRNPTWNITAAYDLLARHNIAYCIFDLAGFQSPIELTADFTYIRLHGPGGKYQGSYSTEALEAWAQRALAWRGRLRDIYFYFDNDDSGYAAANAATLKRLLTPAPLP